MTDGILEEMTIEDVRAFHPEVVVFGVASVEPHGPALPYGTDYFKCDAVIRRGVTLANQGDARALMYPTLPIGNNANFQGFPFACRMAPATLMQVVLDIIEALEQDGIRKVVVYDGHGGNTDTLRATLRAHAHRRRPGEGAFVCLTPDPPGLEIVRNLVEHPSMHGGESEVSDMLYLHEPLVRADKLGVSPRGKLAVEVLNRPGIHFVRPWHLFLPASADGDVRKATRAKGQARVDGAARHLSEILIGLSKAPWTPNFPFADE